MYTLLGLRGNIPTFIHISEGKVPRGQHLDEPLPETGAMFVIDFGYLDFNRLHDLTEASAFSVIPSRGEMAPGCWPRKPVP